MLFFQVFYVGDPQVFQNNFNLSVDAISSLSTADFADVLRKDPRSGSLKPRNMCATSLTVIALGGPLRLSELIQVSAKHSIGPIVLQLSGKHLAAHQRRLEQLHSQLPRTFVVMVSSAEEGQGLSGETGKPRLALTLPDNTVKQSVLW